MQYFLIEPSISLQVTVACDTITGNVFCEAFI